MHRPTAQAGERVAVVSPSGPSDAGHLAAGVARLRARRFEVEDDARRDARSGYLAGDDALRSGALLDALREPRVRAVIASRGGYGAMRLLERDGDALAAALARDPKPMVGFSDVTALHALWARCGVRSIHGAMVSAIGRDAVREDEIDELFAVLAGGSPAPWTGLRVLRAGGARGRAIGGNLALIAALHGTPWAMPLEDAVLFLEDVGERPYRIDRMLTTLRMGGALAKVRAVVLGDFNDCGDDALGVLGERLGDLGVPVLAGGAFGHAGSHRVIAFGDLVTVDARATGRVEFAPR